MVTWVVGILFAAIGFVIGKIFSQSEQVIEQKRRIYERYLDSCPAPNEAHFGEQLSLVDTQRLTGLLTLYASKEVLKYAGNYFTVYAVAQPVLCGITSADHPEFIKVMTAYNRMIWAMRTDVMSWSTFAPKRSEREYKPSLSPSSNQGD